MKTAITFVAVFLVVAAQPSAQSQAPVPQPQSSGMIL